MTDQANLPDGDKPPILGEWRNIYFFVLILHAVIILLFYFFTRYFA